MSDASPRVPRAAFVLGALGLLPPLAGLWAIVLMGESFVIGALFTAVFAYSALIFAFVGGSWWGFASRAESPRWADLLLAVTPTLAAFMSLPLVGRFGPPGALVLAALIALSPIVDRRFVKSGLAPGWWMRLRVPLSLGLALLLTGAVWLMG